MQPRQTPRAYSEVNTRSVTPHTAMRHQTIAIVYGNSYTRYARRFCACALQSIWEDHGAAVALGFLAFDM